MFRRVREAAIAEMEAIEYSATTGDFGNYGGESDTPQDATADYYAILDLPNTATKQDIVERKRQYAQILSPDRTQKMSKEAHVEVRRTS